MDDNEKAASSAPQLSRSLNSRHITMIAIGGAIGTGLFLGSGQAIHDAGPSIIISYLVMGIFTYLLMKALGELMLSDTSKHSFIDFVNVYLGPRAEFMTGWMYWICWISLAMADLTATGIYLKFWFPNLPQWVGPLIIVGLLMLANLVNVGLFGEIESWFSLVKVAAIVALIIVGIIMICSHKVVNGVTASFGNLVNYGGLFPTGTHGFMMGCQMVVFAFAGIEMVGVTAGETANPETELPKAINTLPIRIILFYLGSMIAIMSVYPWNQIKTTTSPFVQVFSAMGIKYAAGIINFVVLTAAMSATNSALFTTSRTLYTLASSGNAPHYFAQLSKKSVPKRALNWSSLVLLIVVALNYFLPSKIFQIISSVSTINFLFVWIIILVCHIRYRQKSGRPGLSPMPGYPFTDWLTLLFFIGILVVLLLEPATRLSLILFLVFFIILFWQYRLLTNRRQN
ncbi:MAG: amino acid permease [Limosilactobacillus sp.]|uniref:amino acid permease n=1 Tax=Limosilactobacillus sp. TaxID=2773925 RepID=UPI002A754800|nr:amino acid permease [Limosilactobacillus sp.]MDD7692813.1 amino acid permease [Lactobacillaceae bacterium]MDY2803480.1 amino acid permease [Limosilactobacillus sp.]